MFNETSTQTQENTTNKKNSTPYYIGPAALPLLPACNFLRRHNRQQTKCIHKEAGLQSILFFIVYTGVSGVSGVSGRRVVVVGRGGALSYVLVNY